jgi:polyphenol oxidase
VIKIFERIYQKNILIEIWNLKTKKIILNSRLFSDLEIYYKNQFIIMDQVHGTDIIEIKTNQEKIIPNIDSIFTKNKYLSLGVQTADCIPIVVFDKEQIAVVHSGWKGTLDNIISNVLSEFKNPNVFFGPFIHSCCYEINIGHGSDKRDVEFIKKYGINSVLYKNEKCFLNLEYILKQQIEIFDKNIKINNLDICTSCNNLPSHFRDKERRNNILLTVVSFLK